MFITVNRFTDGEEVSINVDHISYIFRKEGQTDLGMMDDSIVEVMETAVEILGQIEKFRSQAYVRDSIKLIMLFHGDLFKVKGKE